jgi:hypothetical protein
MIITGQSTIEDIQRADEFKSVEWRWGTVNGLFRVLDLLKKTGITCEIFLDNHKQICYKFE